MTFHAKVILSFFYGAEAPPSPFLKKYYGKIIFLPASCVGKDFFLLPEIHNIIVKIRADWRKFFQRECQYW